MDCFQQVFQRTPTRLKTGVRALLAAGLLLASADASRAQVSIGPEGVRRIDQAEELPRGYSLYQLTLTPAAASEPPLKYALYPRSDQLQPGNSAPFWYRAMFDFGWIRASGGFKAYDENAESWVDGPIEDLPRADVAEFFRRLTSELEEARTAAGRRDTEWDLGLYELRGRETIAFLLQEVQESRQLARLVALRARLAIAEGDYEAAVDWLRVNYRLAHDVALPETLIHQLVAVAITAITMDQTIELIDAPDSPNLYWALATIPDPLIDFRHAYEYELTLPERFLPWLAELPEHERTSEQWRPVFRETLRDLSGLSNVAVSDETPDWQVDLFVTAAIARNYARAKRDLAAWGRPAEEVEQLSVGQAVALHQRMVYERVSQNAVKWVFLDHPAAREFADREHERMRSGDELAGEWAGRETFPIVGLLLPAFPQAREAERRAAIRPVGLMVLEAIRMQAFEDGGRLPASLEEITVVPVPENPVTGEPFPYRVEGETAVLDIATTPFPEDASWFWRIEMTIAPDWTPPNAD